MTKCPYYNIKWCGHLSYFENKLTQTLNSQENPPQIDTAAQPVRASNTGEISPTKKALVQATEELP